MKTAWEAASNKVDALSLRERGIIFTALAFVLVTLINTALLEPLSVKQKNISAEMSQRQEKSKELQAKAEALIEAKKHDENSPLRVQIEQLKQQIAAQDSDLQQRRERLVAPNQMAHLLEQVLSKNAHLQLVSLKTLPVSLLIENKNAAASGVPATQANNAAPQIYKHGVEVTIRGGYLELLQYVRTLEKLPTQMYWADASLSVEKYPDAVFTLTLYTLSFEKIWLTV
ncbi:MAG: agglutinin biogenesis protein [Sideroxydans sp.]|nr:agglutinin biogenesis protein [Sideroxydans sp.]